MAGSWRKIENENGYPSYYNETTNIKQWDHPKFSDIKQSIDECNYIKFSSYRVAAKIRAIQRALYMDEIPISMINGIFEKHRLGMNEASLHLESYDLEAILSDIYFAANKQNHTNTDIDFATELMQNFLYNVYDKDRKGTLQVISTKIALGLLSSAKLSELYRYLYMLCADYNNSVTRFRLQNILTHLTSIAKFLHEDMHFGPQLIQTTLESCFKEFPGSVGISERDFISWLESSPQILCYVATLYRMRCAETVVHKARCSVCKVSPVIGLRYRCLRCSRYTQCQKCFLAARLSHSHKPSHAMREYCTEKCCRELRQLVVKRVFGMLRCSLKLPRPAEFTEPRSLSTEREQLLHHLVEPEVESESPTPLSCPQQQLHRVIRQLEVQNKELQNQMCLLHSRNDKEMRRYLEEHRMHIAAQIQKLKILKEYLAKQMSIAPRSTSEPLVESTPFVRLGQRGRGLELEPYSPIVRPPDFSAIVESQAEPSYKHSVDNVFGQTADTEQPMSLRDISTWIADRPGLGTSTSSTYASTRQPSGSTSCTQPAMQSELDAVLEKLQQILAANLTAELEDSLSTLSARDNLQLHGAVASVETVLTGLMHEVQN